MDAERSKQPSCLRVLLVEDEMMVALLVESMLVELGHEVTGPVGRLNQAVAMAERENSSIGKVVTRAANAVNALQTTIPPASNRFLLQRSATAPRGTPTIA